MKITITATFGRVQVDVPAKAAMEMMLYAVRTAHLAEPESDPSSVTAAAVPPSPEGEGLMRAEGPGAEAKDGMWRESDRELIRFLTQENCGGPEGPGEAKRAEPEEGDGIPGNESGGVTAEADGVSPSSVTACAVPPSPEGEGFKGAVEEGRTRGDGPSREPASTEGAAEQESYRGFLYTRCGKCGKIKGYCSKSYIKGMRCECGHRTPFRNLRVMMVRCSCCGKVFKYHTNLTEEQFTIECLHCGAPVEMMLHGRTGEYVAY